MELFDPILCRSIFWLALEIWFLFKVWSSSFILIKDWHIWVIFPLRSDIFWLIACMLLATSLWIITNSWQNCLNTSVCWMWESRSWRSKPEIGGFWTRGWGGLMKNSGHEFRCIISSLWLGIYEWSDKHDEWRKDGMERALVSSEPLCDEKWCCCEGPATSSPSSAWNRNRKKRERRDQIICMKGLHCQTLLQEVQKKPKLKIGVLRNLRVFLYYWEKYLNNFFCKTVPALKTHEKPIWLNRRHTRPDHLISLSQIAKANNKNCSVILCPPDIV